jgi:RNA 2',3'-cyclic 3'-phosphodiesterase
MKRVFIAIDISKEVRRLVEQRICLLKAEHAGLGIKWVNREKLHLTLRFVGDVDNDGLEIVLTASARAAQAVDRFRLQADGVGVFPSSSNARVLWIGINDEYHSCLRLKDAIESEPSFPLSTDDRKGFTPHLTIARIKDARTARPVIEQHLNSPFHPAEFDVDELTVYESRLLPNGSVYSKLAAFRLGVPT